MAPTANDSASPKPRVRAQSERSLQRRATLIESARRVFERDGFIDARITDIAKEAGLAHGSFYTYFDSKEAVFREVAEQIQHEMFDRNPEQSPDDLSAYERIRLANRRYLEAYARHGRIMAIIEQVSTFNEEIQSIRDSRARQSISRTERSITRLQAHGDADSRVDPHLAAVALTAMVSRFAFLWYGTQTGTRYIFDLDEGVEGLTLLWANAIGVRE